MYKYVDSTWHINKCYLGASYYYYYNDYCHFYYFQLVRPQKVAISIPKLPKWLRLPESEDCPEH